MAEILDVTEQSFETQVLESEQPVLVDFWAEWCAPCRALAPTIKTLADEYEGRLRVAKVDADANPELAAKYSVLSLPTLLFINRGEVTGSLVGNQPKAKVAERIDAVLAS